MLLGQLKETVGGLGRHRTSSGRTATLGHDQPSLRTETRQRYVSRKVPFLCRGGNRVCELLHTGLARTFYGGEIAEQSVMVVGSYSYHRPLWALPPYLTPAGLLRAGSFPATMAATNKCLAQSNKSPDGNVG
jgi:hypothetical protein